MWAPIRLEVGIECLRQGSQLLHDLRSIGGDIAALSHIFQQIEERRPGFRLIVLDRLTVTPSRSAR